MWATSAAELVAGASGLGEWQARIAEVLAAAETLDAILYFDDFGGLFADRPAEGGVELAAAMRRHVVDGRVRVIGELTEAALDRAERRDVSLIGAMVRIAVPPTDPATTWQRAVRGRRTGRGPRRTGRRSPGGGGDRGRAGAPLPAVPRVPRQGGAAARGAAGRARRGPRRARRRAGARRARAVRGVLGRDRDPIALLADDRSLALADVVAALRGGWSARTPRCAGSPRRSASPRPAGAGRQALVSLLFVGPSGVGKTELARSVAAYLFGAPDRMVRLDMSEYTDPWAAERLFGGDGDEGRLTAAVRSQPFGVVLLDEIEKAHGSVFDLLLQVLGEARLTTGAAARRTSTTRSSC